MGKAMFTVLQELTDIQHACRDLRKEMGEEEVFKWYASMLGKFGLSN